MEITSGILNTPQRVVIHGIEGVGKTKLASHLPNPVFADTEGSTERFDVRRTPKPSSWTHLMSIINDLKKDQQGFKTFVIDTADWAEKLLIAELCAKYGWSTLGGQDDFGRSYTLLALEWGRMLTALDSLRDSGMHIVLTAHSKVRKSELVEEFGSYDRWELSLEKKTSNMLKQWPDMLLFLNYKTLVVEDDKTKTKHGQGGERVIYTEHHPCWDAKNRHGFPPRMKLDYANIAHCFQGIDSKPATSPTPVALQAPAVETTTKFPPARGLAPTPAPALQSAAQRKLSDMMSLSKITAEQLQAAVACNQNLKGIFPADTPITNYPDDFIEGCLFPGWDRVVTKIGEMIHE